mmetsp:Transcript_16015/g.11547  ORF Transcript_16015/g.11547 Transcript_16015/m.11547 type:complete len:119 (+) Transcript_16015:298-654(+)
MQTCSSEDGSSQSDYICTDPSNADSDSLTSGGCSWGTACAGGTTYNPLSYPCERPFDCLQIYGLTDSCCAAYQCKSTPESNGFYCVPNYSGLLQQNQFIQDDCVALCSVPQEAACIAT